MDSYEEIYIKNKKLIDSAIEQTKKYVLYQHTGTM